MSFGADGVWVFAIAMFGFVAYVCGRLKAKPWLLKFRKADKKIKD